jgi:hypothetical protein
MIRTTEEILKYIPAHDTTSEDEWLYLKSDVIKAINEARVEILNECTGLIKEQMLFGKPSYLQQIHDKLLDQIK